MLKRRYQSQNGGFTLIELLVALAINVFIFGVLISIFVTNINHYRKQIQINRMNEQLSSAMQLMADETRRAGYWANAENDVGLAQNNNPFQATGIDLSINGSNNCILFAYDHDNNGSLPAVSSSIDDERYGFRLTSNSIQARPPGASFSCAAAANTWESVTDTSLVTVTALSFTPTSVTLSTGPGSRAVILRSVDISLTGQLVGDASVTKTLNQHVRIRNDKFSP